MLKSTTALADPLAMWWPAIAIVVLVVGIAATIHFARNGHAARHRDARRATSLLDEALESDDPLRRAELLDQAASALLRVKTSHNMPTSRFERQRDATFVLGFVRYEQERYVEAIELLQAALRQPLTKATRARGLAWLAISAAYCGNENLSESSFNALVKIRTSPSVRREHRLSMANHMAVLCARRGAFGDADAHLREAKSFSRFALDRASNKARAEVEFQRGNFDEAARLIAAAVDGNVRDWRDAALCAECWVLGARTQIARREFALAGAALGRARTLAPAGVRAVHAELLIVEATLARHEGSPSDALTRAASLLREYPHPLLSARLAAEEAYHGTRSGESAAHALRQVGEALAAREVEGELGLKLTPPVADSPT